MLSYNLNIFASLIFQNNLSEAVFTQQTDNKTYQ